MTEPMSTEKTRRGRPRPQATIDRDNSVYDVLTRPMTRADLVTATGLKDSEVYLSLHRLRVSGRVARGSGGNARIWSRVETDGMATADDVTSEQMLIDVDPPNAA